MQAPVAGSVPTIRRSYKSLVTPNARRSVWCNQYVIEHGDRLVVAHLNPDGMLACLLSEANPGKEMHDL